MNLKELILSFRNLLNSAWIELTLLAEKTGDDCLLDDWMQANWEMIVECHLNEIHDVLLLPYGSGADYYPNSSRILQPESMPTHSINCCSKNLVNDVLTGNKIKLPANGFVLEYFVTIQDGLFTEEPPFDYVLFLVNNTEVVVSADDVDFVLVELNLM